MRLVVSFTVKRACSSTEIHSISDLIRRVRRFINTLCVGGCQAYILTTIARAPETYIKKIEAMITNKTVEYEYDRANARIRRELRILKTIHDKLVSGYLPVELGTLILVSCPISSLDDPLSLAKALRERIDIASKILGLEVECVDVDNVVDIINFR